MLALVNPVPFTVKVKFPEFDFTEAGDSEPIEGVDTGGGGGGAGVVIAMLAGCDVPGLKVVSPL